jgi:estrogen-related receptor beta like 1
VTVQLQKIDQREAFVNAELEPLTQTYRVAKENLAATQRLYDQSAETVADLTNELARVGEKLEEVKHQAQAGAEQIADASPLQRLKTSVGALRSEIGVMEIRIGVVSNALLAMDAKRRDVVV